MKKALALLVVSVFLVAGCSTNQSVEGTTNHNSQENTAKSSTTNGTIGWSAGALVLPHEVDNDAFKIEKVVTLSESDRIQVVGKMRTFEAVGATRLLVNGVAMAQPSGMQDGAVVIHASEGAPAWGDFSTIYEYPPNLKGQTASLEFYFNSPKDGSKQSDILLYIVLP